MESKYRLAVPNPVMGEYSSVFFLNEKQLNELQQAGFNPIANLEPYHVPALRNIWLACQPSAKPLELPQRFELAKQLIVYLLQNQLAITRMSQLTAEAILAHRPDSNDFDKAAIHQQALSNQAVDLEKIKELQAALEHVTTFSSESSETLQKELMRYLGWMLEKSYLATSGEHKYLLLILQTLLAQSFAPQALFLHKLKKEILEIRNTLSVDQSEQSLAMQTILNQIDENISANEKNPTAIPTLPDVNVLKTLIDGLNSLLKTNKAYPDLFKNLLDLLGAGIPDAEPVSALRCSSITLEIFKLLNRIYQSQVQQDLSRTHYLFYSIKKDKKDRTEKTDSLSAPPPVQLELQYVSGPKADDVKPEQVIDLAKIVEGKSESPVALSPFVTTLLRTVFFQSDWSGSMVHFREMVHRYPNEDPLSTCGATRFTISNRTIRLLVNAETKRVEWIIVQNECKEFAPNTTTSDFYAKPEYGVFMALQIPPELDNDATPYPLGTFPDIPRYYGLYTKPEHMPYFQRIEHSMQSKTVPVIPAAAQPIEPERPFGGRYRTFIIAMATLGATLSAGLFLSLIFLFPALTVGSVLPPLGMALALIGVTLLVAAAGAALFATVSSLFLHLKGSPKPAPVKANLVELAPIPQVTPATPLTAEEQRLQEWVMASNLELYRPAPSSVGSTPSPNSSTSSMLESLSANPSSDSFSDSSPRSVGSTGSSGTASDDDEYVSRVLESDKLLEAAFDPLFQPVKCAEIARGSLPAAPVGSSTQ